MSVKRPVLRWLKTKVDLTVLKQTAGYVIEVANGNVYTSQQGAIKTNHKTVKLLTLVLLNMAAWHLGVKPQGQYWIEYLYLLLATPPYIPIWPLLIAL